MIKEVVVLEKSNTMSLNEPMWHNPQEIFTSGNETDVICNGVYGKIRKVYSSKFGSGVVKCYQITGTSISPDEIKKKVHNAAGILHSLRHKNIVSIYGISSWGQCYAIITPYMIGGSLYNLLREEPARHQYNQHGARPLLELNHLEVPIPLKLRMAHDISCGLAYIHSIKTQNDQRITHGSLKTSNILLGPNMNALITDFDAAEIATCTGQRSTNGESSGRQNDIVYSANERINNIYASYTPSMDVYSYGAILYELLLHEAPYQHTTENLWHYISHHPPDMNCFDDIAESTPQRDVLIQIMKECMNRVSQQRPPIILVKEKLDICLGQQDHGNIADIAHKLMMSLNLYDIIQSSSDTRISIDQLRYPWGG